jgi:hypothetical protein
MPVFCLAPIDPSDDAWKGAAFVQRIWVEAIDEPAARAQATAITRPYSHRGRSVARPMSRAWIYWAAVVLVVHLIITWPAWLPLILSSVQHKW